jgi:hypothetical protein
MPRGLMPARTGYSVVPLIPRVVGWSYGLEAAVPPVRDPGRTPRDFMTRVDKGHLAPWRSMICLRQGLCSCPQSRPSTPAVPTGEQLRERASDAEGHSELIGDKWQ